MQNHLRHKQIEAGKPIQNAYIESFYGTFRLNERWVRSLDSARMVITEWRGDYSEHGHTQP